MSASITVIAWWTSFLTLVTRRVNFCNRLALCHFSTAAACPGRAVLLMGHFKWDALLLGQVFAAGGAAAFACAFFLALVLRAGASMFTVTGVAPHTATLRLNRIHCFELIVR